MNPSRRPLQPELPIQQKAYEAVLALVQAVERMPRSHRFTLGDRVANLGYDLLEVLVVARFSRDKGDHLRRANLMLERLRLLLRMAADLQAVSIKGYGHLTGLIDEVGQMLGGWIRSQKGVAEA